MVDTVENQPDPMEKKLTRTQAAEFCKSLGYPVSKSTLDKYATHGGGPKFSKFGQSANARVLYSKPDLMTWIQSQLQTPQSSTSEAA